MSESRVPGIPVRLVDSAGQGWDAQVWAVPRVSESVSVPDGTVEVVGSILNLIDVHGNQRIEVHLRTS